MRFLGVFRFWGNDFPRVFFFANKNFRHFVLARPHRPPLLYRLSFAVYYANPNKELGDLIRFYRV